eukprot:TRINITY_DN2865_c0_g2_i2.p1 TRINITY_DN2865_c0_g2~~TRINITY_DN2865_c0_g2_i2.p1  ORF type:complete len:192 (-),score=16.95 TRINITY_DN2865_c0_g2_i2:151-726(-)
MRWRKILILYSEHVFACRIVQVFVKQYGDKLEINTLFRNDCHLSLCQSMYGNYVIQCIIDSNQWYSNLNGIMRFRRKLITECFSDENILFLSKNKFGSNVIETCIKVSSEKQIERLIYLVSKKNTFVLQQMIRHQYGNYVIKTLLKNCSYQQQIALIAQIEKIYSFNHSISRYAHIVFNEIREIKIFIIIH